jgi:hypothetical protein
VRQPGILLVKAAQVLVGEQVRQRRGHRSLRQQRAERFALVQAERGDVDQAGIGPPDELTLTLDVA